jgi:hypothetical protein
VTLNQTVYQSAELVIDAASEDEAIDIAKTRYGDGDPDIDWRCINAEDPDYDVEEEDA